jgi:diaminopimelate decarboxylase
MTKPIGPIPPGFAADDDGMLMIGGHRADYLLGDLAWRYEGPPQTTPAFVYDLSLIDRKIESFRSSFGGIDLHYAVKANPYEPILRHMLGRVDGFDLASWGELDRAVSAGIKADITSIAGPGKTYSDLKAAILAEAVINIESEAEAERALCLSHETGVAPRLAIRVNPDFEIKGSGMRMGGGAKPFGVDAERVPALVRRILDFGGFREWEGFHIFAGSQALSPDALIEAQRATIDLAEALAEEIGADLPKLNLGGGFGIPYVHGDRPLDIAPIGAALRERIAARGPRLQDTKFAIELGRWLVGECGVYLTRIVDRKVSKGKTFLITDGGMQHQLAASGNFGQVIRRNYPVAIANAFGRAPDEEVTIVGCLCTPLDILADDVMMPRAEVGDIVAVFLAGAYGLTASPQAFLSQTPAREMVVGA